MGLKVYKYGGTSVGSVDRICAVAEQIKKSVDLGNQIVVVVSAMSGETNRLLELAHSLNSSPTPRELDVLVSTGEQVTIALLSIALQARGVKAISYTGVQLGIQTDKVYGQARIQDIKAHRVHDDLKQNRVVVVAGFQGVDSDGNITTLGRGGSDLTAVAIAARLNADECCIYTDVDGVFTADPRYVDKAKKIASLTFDEMLELSGSGAKVLQIRSVEFARKYGVPLRILSSFKTNGGTFVHGGLSSLNENNLMEEPVVRAVSCITEARVTIRNIPDEIGVASKILNAVAEENINVDMIIQNIADKKVANFTFTLLESDLTACQRVLEPLSKSWGATLSCDVGFVKVTLVGIGMRSHAGVAAKMFRVLYEAGINIQAISTSEIKIAVLIDAQYKHKAQKELHNAFELDQ